MSVLIKHMAMPKGCIYANDKDQTEYCPLLNHDDVPFCQYIETEPEIAIGIDERPVYCPLFDVSESCQDTVSRAAAIDALDEIESEIADGYGYQYEKWRKYFCGLPSAQPERKTAEWIYGENGGQDGWYCSKCGLFIPWDYEYYGLDNIDFIADFHTCPKCDRKMLKYTGMRGEQE